MTRSAAVWSAVFCVCATVACDAEPELSVQAGSRAPEPPLALRNEPLQPLPAAPRISPARAAIGGRLFSAANLSADGSVSCATCHPLDRAGADGLMHSRGARGREMPLNTPTIYNASFNFRFNWNGAFASLEEEFDAPISATMDTTWPEVIAKVRSDRALAQAFGAAYADGVTTANIKDALARFIDTLVTPDSRFDQYLRGDPDALTPRELQGYALFKTLGCASCHQGANVGGNLFQRMGVMHDYFKAGDDAALKREELGRFATTKQAADRFVFRVPSLRNVALTPPYFHDGSVATLEQAVTLMGYLQLGRNLSAEQVTSLVAFLKTLTGLHVAAGPHQGTTP